MSEEDLELLITLDDPGEDTLEEDTFHPKEKNTDQLFPTGGRNADVIVDKDPSKMSD